MPLLNLPRFVVVNSAGVPYANAKLYVYRATTTTDLETYTDETFGTPFTNPITADANGLFPSIHFDPSLGYNLHLVMKDQNNATLWDEDNIPRAQIYFGAISSTGSISGTQGLFTTYIQAPIVVVQGSAPYIEIFENDGASDSKRSHIYQDSGIVGWATKTDAGAAGKDIIKATRGSSTALSAIDIGNSTDNPTISFNGVALYRSGTVSVTGVGFSGSVTGTLNYVITGKMVTLYAANSITGTSSATTFSFTTSNASLIPSQSLEIPCALLGDNGNTGFGGSVVIGSTLGLLTLNFKLARTDTVANYMSYSSSGFTGSGTKGIIQGWSVSYPIP